MTVDGKRGYIDSSGKVVIEPQFGSVQPVFSGQLARAWPHGKHGWGYIDRKGNWAIPATFAGARPFSEGLAAVAFQRQWGYIDQTGTIVIKPQFDTAGRFVGGVARIGTEKWWSPLRQRFLDVGIIYSRSYIDRNGDPVSQTVGEQRQRKQEENRLREFKVDRKFGFQDASGLTIVKPQFDRVAEFQDGVAGVKVGSSKWGFIDDTGQIIIPYEFEAVGLFSGSVAPAKLRGKWGLINRRGKWVVEPKFDWSSGIHYGLWDITHNKKSGYLDKSGEYIWEPTN
ncbi:MAG: WG repeat-containing protein [Planctomycetota bacterium]|nr:WG repeat-containing protein [Planctomycetota bacterium]